MQRFGLRLPEMLRFCVIGKMLHLVFYVKISYN